MKAKEYRRLAHEECVKYSGELAIIQLLIELVALLLALTNLAHLIDSAILKSLLTALGTIIILLISGPFSFSFIAIAKKVKEKNKPTTNDLFSGFKRFSQAFIVNVLKTLFLILWTFLLVVPGLIKAYSYSMSEYISYDDPEITANDAITKSREMMDGKKWKLFCLELSYIGWILLVILTLGILGLWVMPKIRQAKYNFYLNSLKEKNTAPVQETKANITSENK